MAANPTRGPLQNQPSQPESIFIGSTSVVAYRNCILWNVLFCGMFELGLSLRE